MSQPTRIIPLHPVSNIVIAGETGVGKSSLINLITGKTCCETGNDVRGVTIRTGFHDWTCDDQMFRLWDTPGLSEGSGGTLSPKKAQDALRSLLSELQKGGTAHLLVLCMRGTTVAQGMKQTYNTVVEIRNKVSPDIPFVAVITQLTQLEKNSTLPGFIASMENWLAINRLMLPESNMEFSGHACITTLTDDCHPNLPGRRRLCQERVRNLIVTGVSLKLVRNIIVAGGVGVGKSSLVNLVLGVDRAPVGDDVRLATISKACYDWEISNQSFRLWDTPGFGEWLQGSEGLGKHSEQELKSLFLELSEKCAGVHLLIICVRGISGVPAMTKRTYDLIIKSRDMYSPNTPVVAVVTKLETQSATIVSNAILSMEQWWRNNSGALMTNNMSFVGHACITCLPDSCQPPVSGRREACRVAVRELITKQSLPQQIVLCKELNVLLFGETGVGKSALVNLLAGWQIASVSPNSAPCTLDAKEYQFQLGRTTIRLWDTVGLDEPEKDEEKGKEGYFGAIEKAVDLIKQLNRAGGISLFLFCIRGSRVTQTTQSNYRLFYEVLGKKEVPIAMAVTQLEREQGKMEDWWQKNVNQLEQYGMQSAGHACITALDGHQRYAQSRVAMIELLSKFNKEKFSMPSEAWIGRIIKRLGSFFRVRSSKGKDLVGILTNRCSLEPDAAKRIADYIDCMDS